MRNEILGIFELPCKVLREGLDTDMELVDDDEFASFLADHLLSNGADAHAHGIDVRKYVTKASIEASPQHTDST